METSLPVAERPRRPEWMKVRAPSRDGSYFDVPDKGAGHYAATIRAIRAKLPASKIEVLTPDFLGVEEAALQTVIGARPDVFNHNIETVRRLHRAMRGGKASYDGALQLLRRA